MRAYLLLRLVAIAACAAVPASAIAADRSPGQAAAGAAERPGPPKAVTPATLQADIAACIAQDPSFWADNDTDRDGQVSQLEIIFCLIHHPAWMRTHFPAQFKAIDTDGDRCISIDELIAFASKATPGHLLVQQRQRRHLVKDETDQQGFEDPKLRKHFDPIAGYFPAGTFIQEGNFDIWVLK